MSPQFEIDLSPLITNTIKGDRITPKRANVDWLKRYHPDLLDKIMLFTHEEQDLSLISRIKLIQMGLNKRNMCMYCKVKQTSSKQIDSKYCSMKCAIKSEEVQEKTNKTCISKYGKRFNTKKKDTYEFGEHHTQKHVKNIDDVNDENRMNILMKGHWSDIAKHFNLTTKSHSSTYNFLRRFGYEPNLISGHSNLEKELSFFVSNELNFDIIENTKGVIKPLEIDIHIPSKNLSIEFNGLFWHSFDKKETNEEKNYHLYKTNRIEKEINGSLIHIFENEWLDKQDIVKSLIRNKLNKNKNRIYARSCKISTIDASTYKNFCEENHMQGFCAAKIKLGLFYDKSLVSVMSFSKPRYNKECDYEIIRSCSKINTTVIGGFSKLLQHFIRLYQPKKIVSYGNRRWCNSLENVYVKNGFTLAKITPPNYFYVLRGKVFNRTYFQKSKLKTKLPDYYDEKFTESKIMFAAGYRRIWDCGNLEYVKECR